MSTATAIDRTRRRTGWLADAFIAGFVATAAVTIAFVVAYAIAAALGREDGNFLTRALWELTHNQVVSFSQQVPAVATVVHIVSGLLWALVYATLAEPRLAGPGWRRGTVFSLLPYLASILALLPAAGLDFLGFFLSAGWLPPVGNLLLHLTYGAVLGVLYDRYADAPDMAEGAPERGEPLEGPSVLHSEGFAAAGILGGVLIGALIGLTLAFILQPISVTEGSGIWSFGIVGAGLLGGGAVGAIVGSFSGLPSFDPDPEEEAAFGEDYVRRNVLSFGIPLLVAALVALLIVSGGSTLLTTMAATRDRLMPVWVALGLTAGVFLLCLALSRRQEPPRSARDTVSHSGH